MSGRFIESTERLRSPLSSDERQSLYARLAKIGARLFSVGEDLHFAEYADEEVIAIAAEESRFDYRLLYVLVEWLSYDFYKLNPYRLRKLAHLQRTPPIWGVIKEFASKTNLNPDRNDFFAILVRGLIPAPLQIYFNDGKKPKPAEMRATLFRTPSEFRKWGFISDEAPISKEMKLEAKAKTFSKGERTKILQHLLSIRPFVTMAEYLVAIDHSVSRQQAHRDCIVYPGVQMRGDRKGRRYYLRQH